MYTQEEYFYGWLFYLLGVFIMMSCGVWLTRGLRITWLRQVIRVGFLALFITPWYADPELSYLAPAWIIAGFEGVIDGASAFWRAGTPMLSGIGIALLGVIVWNVALKKRLRS